MMSGTICKPKKDLRAPTSW